ncbi:MAG: DEAD/DEAH box helicase [Negativicutes bacterium]|nr:DEAD/DEAH box helicase [Negativicutes bacterium]
MFTDEYIRKQAGALEIYFRGFQYYKDGRVIHISALNNVIHAEVAGSERYEVEIELEQSQDKLKTMFCNCPAFRNYNGACKHVVAALKAAQDNWLGLFKAEKGNHEHSDADELLAFFRNRDEAAHAVIGDNAKVRLVPTYSFFTSNNKRISTLEFSIGTDKMYIVKNIKELIRSSENEEAIVYGKKFVFSPTEMDFDADSQALFDLVRTAYLEEQQIYSWSAIANSSNMFPDAKHFYLTQTNLNKFFDLMGQRQFAAKMQGEDVELKVVNEVPPLLFSAIETNRGIKLSLGVASKSGPLYSIDNDARLIYHGGVIYRIDQNAAKYFKHLMKFFGSKRPDIYLPMSAVSDFFSSMLPAVGKIATVTIDETIYEKLHQETLEKFIYMDKSGDGISVRVSFQYGDMSLNPGSKVQPVEIDGKTLLRDTVQENILLSIFYRHGFEWEDGKLYLEDEEGVFNFLHQSLTELNNLAEVFYSDDFKTIQVKKPNQIRAGVMISADTDLLEVSLDYGDMTPKEMIEVLMAFRMKKRYHRLKNGAFIDLNTPELQTAAKLIENLGFSPADIENKVLNLPKFQAMYLDNLARENTEFTFVRSGDFRRMVRDIREPQDVEYEVPESLVKILREYQITGFSWLKSLARYGLGGVLGDDMGLGKTLQVIAFILSERIKDPAPSIVVAPTSLLYNWFEEVVKFAPGLKVAIIDGQQDERKLLLEDIEDADIVITSYGLMRRDVELYSKKQFKYCFIDEAQNIKNPNTLNSQSAKQLKAKSYFALTGTPMENTLTDLWSIFDFLMPGYLGSHKSFVANFENPIVKHQDMNALHELNRRVKPFVLRRLKREVLKELPDKIESRMVNEMTAQQARLYSAWLSQARNDFESEVAANGFGKSQIKILSLLTRLRQLCCHPSLFIEDYCGGSGKLDMLQELVDEAIGGGHRILIFSQFTEMLGIIKKKLDSMSVSYYYLDGATKSEERFRMAQSFNTGMNEVFLISLKAGGTGLNLTGADVVIHFDPWWNPAVENQASDRAHRYGQNKAVQVYKLITKGTIEEKIYSLQEKKKELIDALIQPGENFLTKMTEDEIRGLFAP